MSTPPIETAPLRDGATHNNRIIVARSLWRHPDFLKFWTGETVSLFGSQITLLALPLAAVLTLNASAEQLGLLRFLESAPYLIFPLFLGAWIDQRPKRPLMLLANGARALLIASIPLLALTHLLSLTPLFLLTFCTGIFTVIFDICWLSFVPALVGKEQLLEANTKVTTSSAAAEVAGPGMGGALIQLLSAPLTLLLDSLSYIVSFILLLFICYKEPLSEHKQEKRLLKEIGVGLRFVWQNPYVRVLAFQAGAWNFFFAIVDIAFLLYVIRQIGFTPGTLGVIYGMAATGGLLGSAIAGPLTKRWPLGPMICATFMLGSIPFILLPILHGTQILLAILFTLVFFLVRTALGIYAVQSTSLRQAITPPALMARMNAGLRLISYSGSTLGPLVAGYLCTWLGATGSLWIACCGFILALIPLWLSPVRHLQAFPSETEDL